MCINLPLDLKHRNYYLSGPEGNAFAIMATVKLIFNQFVSDECLTREEYTKLMGDYRTEALTGDYDNLIKVTNKYVQFNWIYPQSD